MTPDENGQNDDTHQKVARVDSQQPQTPIGAMHTLKYTVTDHIIDIEVHFQYANRWSYTQ